MLAFTVLHFSCLFYSYHFRFLSSPMLILSFVYKRFVHFLCQLHPFSFSGSPVFLRFLFSLKCCFLLHVLFHVTGSPVFSYMFSHFLPQVLLFYMFSVFSHRFCFLLRFPIFSQVLVFSYVFLFSLTGSPVFSYNITQFLLTASLVSFFSPFHSLTHFSGFFPSSVLPIWASASAFLHTPPPSLSFLVHYLS